MFVFGSTVEFRMIVFRPFKGEIITGTVQHCVPTGIQSKSHQWRSLSKHLNDKNPHTTTYAGRD